MKKFFALILVMLLTFCGCQIDVQLDDDFLSQFGSDASIVSEYTSEYEVTQYKGKDNYQNISTGAKELVQNEKYYYYCNEYGFFAVDKQSKEHILLSEEHTISFIAYEDMIYFGGYGGDVTVFDTKTHKFETKSYEKLFSLKLEVPQTRYTLSTLMVKDGWLVYINDMWFKSETVFFTDRDFTKKTELPMCKFDFVLDDEVFWFDESGAILCYNLTTGKFYSVNEQLKVDEEKDSTNYLRLEYIGKDRILAYAEEKLNIISLKTGKICLTIPYSTDKYLPSVVYDDDNSYLFYEEDEDKNRLDVISFADNSIKTIYRNELDVPYTYCGLADIDEDYLYLGYSGYQNTDGTESSKFATLNKDGTNEQTLFYFKNIPWTDN